MRNQLEAMIQKFVADITALVRQSAIEALEAPDETPVGAIVHSLQGDMLVVEDATHGRAVVPLAPKRPSGKKRKPKALAKLVEDLHAHILLHAGDNIETIARDMGKRTRELTLPITKLLAARRIKRSGVKRATRYWALAPKTGKKK